MLFRFLRKIAISITFAWTGMLTVVTASSALEPSTPLARLGRQAWTIENGLPQNTVPMLLQSHDGFLWAGTEVGLARFDGVSFRVYDHSTTAAFPDAEVRCLLDGGDGSLWVGTGNGLVRWKNGGAQLFLTSEGLPSNFIRGLAQTSDGAVWVWTETGLARWDGKTFQAVPLGNELAGITSIAADGSGALWAGTEGGSAVFRTGHWLPGPDAAVAKEANSGSHENPALVKAVFGGDVLISSGAGVYLEHDGAVVPVLTRSALPVDGVSFLDRLSDGTFAIASKSSMVLTQGTGTNSRILSRIAVAKELPGSRMESVYADREGCLWVGTNRGLARISIGANGTAVQLLPPTDPLASNAIVSLLEDREGDLWVGTESAGLQILRDARFHVIGSADGLNSDETTAVAQDANRALWIGTRDAGLNRLSIDSDGKPKVTSFTTGNGLLSNVILSLAAGADGNVWVGTPDGLNRIGHGRIASFTSADGLADDFIRSVFVAPDGSIWIGTRRGLTHMEQGHFQSYTQADGLGSDLVGALTQTTDGDLWIATLNGLSRLHQGKLRNYTVANGLSSNVITALDVTGDGTMWVGTQADGLNRWDGKRFVPMRGGASGTSQGQSALLPSAIHSIVHDDRGHLWLATDSGLTRVDLHALLGCAGQGQEPGKACDLNAENVVNFTTADGLRSRGTSSNSHPTSCRASDGKLWFTTPRGVVVADPIHFPATLDAPPVAIERFAVDDRDMQASQPARIAAGALRFQFDYAGLSFAAPQKLRYQYMLEGFDKAWTNAGTRRTAYYTNIPPGKYRFRVRTALGDAGLTHIRLDSSDDASLSFELLPHFYQTLWFRAFVIMAIAAMVALVFRRRVLHVEREFGAVMAERNRIAREIHDTLAQGYVGISLQLEILGELLRHNRADAAAKHLKLTQGLVREGLDDARQSIWALRSHDAGEQTLPIRLRRLVEQAGDERLTASLEIHGAYRALAADVEQEILRIAQEAIHNVKRHAAASRLSVRLDYDERALALTIADDGKGFAASSGKAPRNAASAAEGHYGLTGMRERSAVIQGELEVASTPGAGTTVRLRVSAPEARSKGVVRDDSGA